jgi:enterochelin esterase-like enzyme
MLVYLPPGYEVNMDQRYPVIYYLHGFTSSDSTNLEWFETDKKLEFAFQTKKIRPFILVVANQYTLYQGSFYTNSSLTGSWSDFTARDLVHYIDSKYRTIPQRKSRGVCGWSMGGSGTIKIGMLYPDVFSCAYAMSPGLLTLYGDYGASNQGFKDAQELQTREELFKNSFDGTLMVAMGRAFSPNPDKPPFFADLPFSYEGDSLITHYDILKKWYDNLPYDMIDSYAENFSKLKAFKMDWGKHDNPVVYVSCRMFSEKLEALGIEHYSEEFIGNHGNKLWSLDGRMINDVLPFFNANLEFQEE